MTTTSVLGSRLDCCALAGNARSAKSIADRCRLIVIVQRDAKGRCRLLRVEACALYQVQHQSPYEQGLAVLLETCYRGAFIVERFKHGQKLGYGQEVVNLL